MIATTKQDKVRISDKLAVDAVELQTLLGCGRHTAVRIGSEAGARMQIGKRVLWNVSKVSEYLNTISAD